MHFVPRKVFLTKGVGRHREKLQSFELALRDAKIAQFNLVPVSSIYPPGCKLVGREEGLKELSAGQVVFLVMSRNETNEPQRLIAASVGLAVPKDKGTYGYLSEDHSFGKPEKEIDDHSEDLAASMLASTLGIDFNPDESYDARKNVYKMSGKIVRSTSSTQSAIGDKKGWTSVVACAVFIM